MKAKDQCGTGIHRTAGGPAPGPSAKGPGVGCTSRTTTLLLALA
jgi:hypothetical protein